MENIGIWRISQGAATPVTVKQSAPTTAQQVGGPSHQYQNYPNGGEGWVRPSLSPAAVVFVHGFGGHFHSTWTWTPSWWAKLRHKAQEVNLLGSLLASEIDLPCDYYSFSHNAGNFDVNGIADLAVALRTFLETTVIPLRSDRPVVLVSHSLGGVLCRQAVLDQLETSIKTKTNIVGLLMIGTPNLGAEIAYIAQRSRSGKNIEPWDDYLDRLNRAWLGRVLNGGDPDLPPHQRIRLKCGALYGNLDRIVPAASAKSGVYLGQINAVAKGHIALPKCETKLDPVYGVLTNFIKAALEEANREKLKQSVDSLSYNVRQGVLAPQLDWTFRESELIELTPNPNPQVLNCKITSQRVGWKPRAEVVISLSLESTAPPDGVHVDYGYIFGRGALTEAEYAALGDSLREASLTKQEFDKLLSVDIKLVTTGAGERDAHFDPPQLNVGPGFAYLRYPLQQPGAVSRDNRLTITLRTNLRRHQAWYGFRSTRTVLEKIDLQLTAPFPLHPLSRFWWSDAHWQPETLGTNYYSSKITIPGPFPAGTDVLWLFEPETGK